MNYFDDAVPIELWINHILPHLNYRETLNLNRMNKWMNYVTKKTEKYQLALKVVKDIFPLYHHLIRQPANPRICEFHCPWCPQEHLSYANNTIRKKRGATRSIDRKEIHKQHTSAQKMLTTMLGCQCPFCGIAVGMSEIKTYVNKGCTLKAANDMIDNMFVKKIYGL